MILIWFCAKLVLFTPQKVCIISLYSYIFIFSFKCWISFDIDLIFLHIFFVIKLVQEHFAIFSHYFSVLWKKNAIRRQRIVNIVGVVKWYWVFSMFAWNKTKMSTKWFVTILKHLDDHCWVYFIQHEKRFFSSFFLLATITVIVNAHGVQVFVMCEYKKDQDCSDSPSFGFLGSSVLVAAQILFFSWIFWITWTFGIKSSLSTFSEKFRSFSKRQSYFRMLILFLVWILLHKTFASVCANGLV